MPISVHLAASVTGTRFAPARLPPRRIVCNGGSCSSDSGGNRSTSPGLVVAADGRGVEREQHRLPERQFQFRARHVNFLALLQPPRHDAQHRNAVA